MHQKNKTNRTLAFWPREPRIPIILDSLSLGISAYKIKKYSSTASIVIFLFIILAKDALT